MNSKLFVDSIAIDWESVGEGVRRKILGHNPDLMMVHVEFKKNSIGPIHAHPHTQVTYVTAGSFNVHIGADVQKLSAGDCFFIPPNIDHGVLALEDGELIDVFTPTREDFLQPAH